MKTTLIIFQNIKEYINANFEKSSEFGSSESEIALLLNKAYEPEVQYAGESSKAPIIRDSLSDDIDEISFKCVPEEVERSRSPFKISGHVVFSKLKEIPELDSTFERNEEIKRELESRDEGFRDMLFRMIDEKGMTDAECYKKAQLTRGHFNKIKNDYEYNPKKLTVVALGLALELPMDEFIDFVSKAGYSLTKSNAFDLIIRYAVSNRVYNIDEVNSMLFDFDQQILGAGVRS